MSETIHRTRDFIILNEEHHSKEEVSKTVNLDKEMIGFVFYASGKVAVDVAINKKIKGYIKKTGQSSSFFYSPHDTVIKHHISGNKKLNKTSLFITPKDLNRLLRNDQQILKSKFKNILNPDAPFVEGSSVLINHEMQSAIHKIKNCQFTGITKDVMLESQAMELLSHYLNESFKDDKNKYHSQDIEKLYYAKELLLSNLETPMLLSDLSKQCGLNTFKLKKGFKDVFGLPVYQYLLNARMQEAHKAILDKGFTVQEAAWLVGYSSLGSFSNAFAKKYGIRPSLLRR